MAANDGFNGSTISFGSAGQAPLRDVEYSEEAAKVDVTGAGDAEKSYVAGIPDKTITFTVVGVTSVLVGDEGAVSIGWNDGSTSTLTAGVVTGVAISGSLDGEITSSVTIVPT